MKLRPATLAIALLLAAPAAAQTRAQDYPKLRPGLWEMSSRTSAQSKDDAPEFFGQENRYGHRVYGGVILNVVR